MVLWDKIIQRGDSAVLDLKDMKAKYYFFDDGHGLRFVSQSCVLLYFWCAKLTGGTVKDIWLNLSLLSKIDGSPQGFCTHRLIKNNHKNILITSAYCQFIT